MPADIMLLAAASLNSPAESTTLCAFAECLVETYPESPWGEALLAWIGNRSVLESSDLMRRLHRKTVHAATVRGAILLLTPHLSYKALRSKKMAYRWRGVEYFSWAPSYWRLFLRPTEGLRWRRHTPRPYRRAGKQVVRMHREVLSVSTMVDELYAHGGIDNVAHAVLGAHYFNDELAQVLKKLRNDRSYGVLPRT